MAPVQALASLPHPYHQGRLLVHLFCLLAPSHHLLVRSQGVVNGEGRDYRRSCNIGGNSFLFLPAPPPIVHCLVRLRSTALFVQNGVAAARAYRAVNLQLEEHVNPWFPLAQESNPFQKQPAQP